MTSKPAPAWVIRLKFAHSYWTGIRQNFEVAEDARIFEIRDRAVEAVGRFPTEYAGQLVVVDLNHERDEAIEKLAATLVALVQRARWSAEHSTVDLIRRAMLAITPVGEIREVLPITTELVHLLGLDPDGAVNSYRSLQDGKTSAMQKRVIELELDLAVKSKRVADLEHHVGLLGQALGEVLEVDDVVNGLPMTGPELLLAATEYVKHEREKREEVEQAKSERVGDVPFYRCGDHFHFTKNEALDCLLKQTRR